MSSGGGSSSISSGPWKDIQPYLKDFLKDSQTEYKQNDWFSPYTGQTVTPFSSQTQQALGQIQQLAQAGNPLGDAAMSNALGVLNSGGMTQQGQQALQGAMNVATGATNIGTESDYRGLLANATNDAYDRVIDTQANKIADQVNLAASGAGRYGSMAHSGALVDQIGDFREKAAANQFNQNIQNQLGILNQVSQTQGANIANQVGAGQAVNSAYNQGLGTAAGYSGLVPALDAQRYAGADRLASVGAQYEDLTTRQNQAALDLWNSQKNQDLYQLQAYSGLLGLGTGAGGGTQTTQQPANYATGLGGAISGYGLGSSLFGSYNAAGQLVPSSTGGILGALGGGLLGFLSDEREKTDIEPIGPDPETGIMLYSYRYKGDPKSYPKVVGPMAQDLERAAPGSVRDVGGKKVISTGYRGLLDDAASMRRAA